MLYTVGVLVSGNLACAPRFKSLRQCVLRGAAPKSNSPEIAASIWQGIDAKSAALKKIIDAGKLGEVHHEAFAIRDLVGALAAHSTSLPADKLAKVRDGVKFVSTLAARLDAAGDVKDMAGTKQNYEKLMTVLALLRSNYASSP